MLFDDEIKQDDQVFEVHGIKVVVDPVSYPFVQGAEIDFVDGLMGRGFTVRNPNATATCGCGHSFSV
jgi:iron-sulfur cluster assembly accessory protein